MTRKRPFSCKIKFLSTTDRSVYALQTFVENTCMGPNVTLQEPRSGETLSADVTFARLVVRSQMHGESRHGDIDF